MSTLLLVVIFLPLAGAAGLLAFRGVSLQVARGCALSFSLATLVGAAVLIVNYPQAPSAPPGSDAWRAAQDYAATDVVWIGRQATGAASETLADSGFDIHFHVGLDGISLWLFGLSALLMVTSVLVSWNAIRERAAMFYGMLLLLEFGCLGVFAARDLILFYVFFEFTLLPLFFLIGIWGSEQRRYAAVKFFLFTLAGSLLTFLGLLALVLWGAGKVGAVAALSGDTAPRLTFSISELTEQLSSAPERIVSRLDRDGDRRLTINEALSQTDVSRRAQVVAAWRAMAFEQIDADRDGSLSREEMVRGRSGDAAVWMDQVWRSLSTGGRGLLRHDLDRLNARQLARGGIELAASDLRKADLTFQMIVFGLLLIGFAIKVPLVPLHTWLPLAHVQAPTAGSVFLAGVLLKIGAYGLVRFNVPMLPEATAAWAPWLLWISLAGILYGALVALAQSDIKRLIAYSSVSHMGFCILGVFAMNPVGMQGGALQMINHGISTGALFALVGMLYERYHTREISSFGGLARKLPRLSFCMLLFTFSSIGLPGLNGFAGEFLVLLGMFQKAWTEASARFGLDYRIIAVLSVLGVVLGAWYMLWLVQRVFFGPLREPATHHEAHGSEPAHAIADLNLREGLALAPLAVFALWIGLAPQHFLDRMDSSVRRVLSYSQDFEASPSTARAAAASPAAREAPAAVEPDKRRQSPSELGRNDLLGAGTGPAPLLARKNSPSVPLERPHSSEGK